MEYKDIINGCKKGNASSQRELVRKFARLFKAISIRYLPDQQSADDAVQETFINIFKHINDYRGDGSFEGWVKRISVNTSLNYRKKYFKKNMQIVELVNDNHEKEQIPDAIKNIREEELMAIINQLPEQYYLVFNLFVIEGMSHKEIASTLDITSSTSRATLSRARIKLIHMLNNEDRFTDSYINNQKHGL